MRLKKTLKTSFVSLVVVQPFLSSSVEAMEPYETGGGVGFQRGTGLIQPLHPGPGDLARQPMSPLPEEIQKPNRTSSQGTGSSLSIDYVSEFVFKMYREDGEKVFYYAQPQYLRDEHGQSTITPNFIQVTDQRGTAEGWTLKLQKTIRFYDGNKQALQATDILLYNPVVVGYQPANQPRAPSLLGQGEDSVVIAQAEQGSGTGTTTIRWGNHLVEMELYSKKGEVNTPLLNRDVQLLVPIRTNRQNHTYQATLTWILSEIPRN